MIAALNAKRDQIARRLNDLNREMMLQPMEERRANWDQYYRRLSELMRLQDDVTEAMTATLGLGTSGQARVPSVSALANPAHTRRP